MVAAPTVARAADYHHVHITASAPGEAVKWYTEHLECQPLADRDDAANCSGVELVFVVQPTMGGTQGTGVNHIGFSYADLTAKMTELEAVGVRGSGVRLQRFPDGSTVRDIPGLFKIAFIFDLWGTRIELVEDSEYLGFHHVHLSATDPEATLAWYRDVMGGEPASLRGSRDGLLFGDVWFLVSKHPEGAPPATTAGRAIDHVGFVVDDLDEAASAIRQHGVSFLEEPAVPENARTSAKRAFIAAPDNVLVAMVETGFAGVTADLVGGLTTDATESFDAPQTPWGDPDLQGVWTGNSAHGIPLERPLEAEALTPAQAEARRERGTLGSIWGYEREWRDTTLGYVKTAPSTQVAMIIDPPDGRVPPMTASGLERINRPRPGGEEGSYTRRPAGGPEDLTPYVRCITRGLPGMMMPSIYNNGLQITQAPGFVTIQKEMVHETRVIPTTPRPRLGADLDTWLGDPQGRWEGATLVIETSNFNGRAGYRGSSAEMTLTERYTRIGPTTLEYQFTVDDPETWTSPWTGRFNFDLDNDQYELVEYACHEGNYGMTNILSGARAQEAAEASSR